MEYLQAAYPLLPAFLFREEELASLPDLAAPVFQPTDPFFLHEVLDVLFSHAVSFFHEASDALSHTVVPVFHAPFHEALDAPVPPDLPVLHIPAEQVNIK